MQDVRELVAEHREADDQDNRQNHHAREIVDELIATTFVLPHIQATGE